MYAFKMPALGAEMTQGTLLEWKVKEGDEIKAHDIIAVIDTDKAAIEAESFRGGVVESLVAKPGDKVSVGTVLAYIRESEEAPAPIPAPQKISPLAKRLAHELNVDTSAIQGTGPEGAIVEADIRGATTPQAPHEERAVSMKRVIAAAMTRSKREIPHYYLSNEVDLSKTLAWLEAYNQEHSMMERMLVAAPLIKAVAMALKKYPEFNGYYVEEAFKPSDSINVGFAISLRGGGLIAPALLDVASLTVVEVMERLTDLATRTREGKLRGREMSDSTITITSLGEFGVDSVFGVIYPPQVALVGMGKITCQKNIVITLSADHRVSNGLTGSRFLAAIGEFLQKPEKML